ncbi:forkhead box protein N3-like [Physella acuta]|uniref:forkhead box protein N3-like n=1 Tax=Physella acuta TaxID=109671 RepID=UPI0027DD875F|nr:forkhead box protein N3-like [Physella acuta]
MNDSGCEDTVPTMSHVCKLPEESDASMRARLFTSLSQSFPHSQLYKALHGGEDVILNGGDNTDDDDDSLYGDHLSNSCFASLRMDRRDSDDFDDDLQSLEWLQSEDLLKNIGGEKLDKDEDDNEEQKENEDIKPEIATLQPPPGAQPHLPYLPQKHVNSKPPYSFSCLIFMAVEASPQKRLPVKDIYNWILTQFPYFQNAPTGWKNSVRHNLSLNKCFKKVEKDKGQSIGKGSLWCIDPAYRPNLLQALRKTPYHPYHQLQMTSTQPQNFMQYQSLPTTYRPILPLTQRPVPNTVSPHLFPFLSRRLAQTSFDVDNEMKDVAQTLVALKSSYKPGAPDGSPGGDTGLTWKHRKRSYSYNNPRRRPSSPVTVTEHPYDDHAYSSSRLLDDDDASSPSSSSSIDEEYDFGDADEECESDYQSDMEWDTDDKDEVDGDLSSTSRPKADGENLVDKIKEEPNEDSEEDEQKKIHEGASALLNLAGLLLNNRSSASSSSPEAGLEKRKHDKKSDKTKKLEKKKMGKKRVEMKVVSKQADSDVSQKRSVSKRKNAGSNGKYDNEDYSLIKVNRTPTKGRPPKIKQKVIKSSASKETPKLTSITAKSKSSIKLSTNDKVSKKHTDKKLKLSKTFGMSKRKSSDSLSEKKSSVTQNKALKNKSEKNTKEKSQKYPAKVKRKSKTVDQDESSDILPSVDKQGTDIQQTNVDSKTSGKEGRGKSASDRQLNNHTDNSRDKDRMETMSTKEEIISPAGDAPVSRGSNSIISQVKSLLQKPKLNETIHSSVDDNTGSSKRNGISSKSNSSALIPTIPGSHRSPHFTRFSKKKAELS